MFSPPLHSSSHHPVLTSVREQLCEGPTVPATLIVFLDRLCTASLISSSFNTVPRCKTLSLAHFDPLTSFTGRHSSREAGESIFLCGSWRQHERIKRQNPVDPSNLPMHVPLLLPLWSETGVGFWLEVSSTLKCPPVNSGTCLNTPCRGLLFEGAPRILGRLEERLWVAGCWRFLDGGQPLQRGAHIAGDGRILWS